MTIKIEIEAANAEELKVKLLTMADLFRMGANVQAGVEAAKAAGSTKSVTKVEAADPEPEEVEEKTPAKGKKADKPAAAPAKGKKPTGPSEETLREYVGTLAAYLLNDPEEAPKLDELLENGGAADLEAVEADDLLQFAKDLYEVVDSVFDDVPKVPAK